MQWRDTMFFDFEVTDEQAVYIDSIFENRLTIVNARSGSGKTTMAVASAKLLGKPLLYVFSPVEENVLGYTPGTLHEKELKYAQPLFDALLAINENPEQVVYNPDDPLAMKNVSKKIWVETKSHTFARGTNHKGKTVFIDEAQNWTKAELKKMLTRCHDDCTVIVAGHMGQCDLPNPNQSGFPVVLDYFKDKSYAKICSLTKDFRGELARDADDM